jgi:DNA-binding HxlR family transcriptional regulator
MVSKLVLTRGLLGTPPNPEPEAASVYAEACPSRAILELIADKWTLLILPALRRGRLRNGDLMRLIGGVSQKMLTQTLRELERNGLVKRIDHQEVPPRVEYELTELGRSLSDLMRKLDGWVEGNLAEVLKARATFEAREKAGNGP